MSSDNSLDSSLGQKGEPWDISAASSSEFVDEIPLVRRARDKTSRIRGYWLVWQRLVIKDEVNDDGQDPVMSDQPSGTSRKSIREACLDRTKAFSTSDNDNKLVTVIRRLLRLTGLAWLSKGWMS